MARITGGEVTYMERRKIGDYEHKEAKAVLTFSLDEGDDHDTTLDSLTVTAKARVHEMLGLTPAKASTPPVPAQLGRAARMVDPAPSPLTQTPIEAPVKRGPGRPPKVPAAPAPAAEAPKAVEPASEPAPRLEAPANQTIGEPTMPILEPPVDDLDALLGTDTPALAAEAPIEITDEQLTSKVTAVMKGAKDRNHTASAIKEVIKKSLVSAGITNTTGKQLRDIPMTHRAAFVEHLGAI